VPLMQGFPAGADLRNDWRAQRIRVTRIGRGADIPHNHPGRSRGRGNFAGFSTSENALLG
jgi:hypothetical protein